jgi:hypothetical protein
MNKESRKAGKADSFPDFLLSLEFLLLPLAGKDF